MYLQQSKQDISYSDLKILEVSGELTIHSCGLLEDSTGSRVMTLLCSQHAAQARNCFLTSNYAREARGGGSTIWNSPNCSTSVATRTANTVASVGDAPYGTGTIEGTPHHGVIILSY
jgi:hypothetical protein